MAKVYAISNHKGGVGKSTSTVNIGAGLVNNKKAVLLIDLDPQANLTQSVGVNEASIQSTIYEVLKGEAPIQPITIRKGFDIVPSSLNLAGAEIELSGFLSRETILKRQLAAVKDNYDYVLIDCPPSLGLLTVNAFVASDKVLIPLQSEFLALHGLSKILEILNLVKENLNPALDLGGVFITRFDNRKVLNKDIAKAVSEQFQNKVYKTMIRENVALAEAPSRGMDIFTYNPKSTGAEDYTKLVKEILSSKK